MCEDLQRYTVMVTTVVMVSHSHPPTPSIGADVHNNQNSLVKGICLFLQIENAHLMDVRVACENIPWGYGN